MKRLHFIIFFLATLPGLAQRDLKEANALFDKLAYADAIPKFEKIIADNPTSFEAKSKLAESYRLTGNYHAAEKWYEQVVANSSATDLDRFHYGQMLMNNGKHNEARKWLEIAGKERPHDDRVENYLTAMDDINRFFADSINYKISNPAWNGTGNDFSPVFYNNDIVYTSSQHHRTKSQTHSWTGQTFTRLYQVSGSGQTQAFAREIQIKLNNGPAIINGKEMYSTINVLKVADAKKDVYKLNIVRSVFDGKKWSKTENFIHNSAKFNTAHPALSPDGTRIYFSSDMPGGEGGMDLYYCEKSNGMWTDPVNLGKEVNTLGNEVFPFVDEHNILYFASNGHEGIGGLDIYAAVVKAGETSVTALSFPVNSRFDDFGFIIDKQRTQGYFSSNRPGGKGGDDIYRFEFAPSLLQGIALNQSTNEKLAQAEIVVKDITTGKEQTAFTDSLGNFSVPVSACHQYEIKGRHERYAGAVTKDFKASCISIDNERVELLFANPQLTFNPIDKYTQAQITGVSIELLDAQSKELIKKIDAEKKSETVEPCREYLIVATKSGLPTAKVYFKTSCVAKDETVNVPMGLPPPDPTFIGGIVYDQQTKKPLDSVAIIVYDTKNIPVSTITSLEDGTYAVTGFKNIDRLVFFRNGYFSVAKVMKDQKEKKQIVTEMPKLQLDRIIQLEGIFYDLGKFNIRPDAARVLDNVVKVMQENITLKIELGAHTDARGNDDSNMTLSDKRAKAAAAYIISKGIDASRISGKGYGESVLKNKCGNGVKCNENDHQINRRTEVKITGY